MYQIRVLLFCFSLLLLTSCESPCYDYAVMGADEFVCDSYKIRQGKMAILELEGIDPGELSPETLEEYKDAVVEDDILNIVVYHPTRKDLMEAFQYINNAVGGFRVYRGEIDTPFIPPIYVGGLTLDEARELIQQNTKNKFKISNPCLHLTTARKGSIHQRLLHVAKY